VSIYFTYLFKWRSQMGAEQVAKMVDVHINCLVCVGGRALGVSEN
jgi:hypothetical protein